MSDYSPRIGTTTPTCRRPTLAVERQLGQGGGGVVYEVRDPFGGRTVALKTLRDKNTQSSARRNFLREIAIASILEHPQIVPVYESGFFSDGTPYYLMKKIDGGSLHTLLAQGRSQTPPLSDRLDMFEKICQGMDYAHSKNVLHRDLKPANIAWGDFGEVLILDWGTAAFMEDGICPAQKMVGTPGYMSPEQIREEPLTVQTDIFSLGAILYKVVTLSGAFPGTAKERLVGTTNGDYIPVSQVETEEVIPPELAAVVEKALALDPGDRYQTVGDLIADLQSFRLGYGVSARRDSLGRIISRWARRNVLVLTMVFLVLLAAGVSMTWMKWRTEGARRGKVERYIADVREKVAPLTAFVEEIRRGEGKRYSRQSLEASLVQLLEARQTLERARELDPNHGPGKELLSQLERSIGLVALAGKNYLLSRLSFDRCHRLVPNSENERLSALIDEDRERVNRMEKQRIDEIMAQLKNDTDPLLRDQWVTEILRMEGSRRIKVLIDYLKQGDEARRKLAVEALGKVARPYLDKMKFDLVSWLIEHLKELDPKKNQIEAEQTIWALARLADERACIPVYNYRYKSGEGSALFMNTRIPFSMIPPPDHRRSDLSSMDVMIIAMNYTYKKDFARAVSILTELMEKESKNPEIYDHLSYVYLQENRSDKALEILNRGLKLDPNHILMLGNRSSIYREKGQFTKAAQDLTKILSLKPEESSAYEQRSFIWSDLTKHKKALADIDKAISIWPDQPVYHNTRGAVLNALGRPEDAVKAFSRAIELSPTYAAFFKNRSSTYLRLKDFSSALEDADQALKMNPHLWGTYFYQGVARAHLGRFEGARKSLNLFLEKTTQRVYPLWLRVSLDIVEGKNLSRAWRDLDELKKIHLAHGKNVSAQTRIVQLQVEILLAKNRELDARRLLQEALRKYNTRYHLLVATCLILRHQLKYDHALKVLTQTISQFKNGSRAYYERGRLYKEIKGDYRAAAKDFVMSLEKYKKLSYIYLSPHAVHYHLGECRYRLKQYDQARESFRRYLQYRPHGRHAAEAKGYLKQLGE